MIRAVGLTAVRLIPRESAIHAPVASVFLMLHVHLRVIREGRLAGRVRFPAVEELKVVQMGAMIGRKFVILRVVLQGRGGRL